MYRDLRLSYWWLCKKMEITWYIERCLTYWIVKAEHQTSHGNLYPFEVPMWKWEQITMDFITKLLRTAKGFDAIWVIMERLSKSAHFLAIRESPLAEKLAHVYVHEIVACHGVPASIISDRDVQSI